MIHHAIICSLTRAFATLMALVALAIIAAGTCAAQGEPTLVPDVVDFAKLVPLMPEPPASWNAEKAEGSTTDAGDMRLTTVHRDYTKGTADGAPVTSISILDTVANADLAQASIAGWNVTNSSADGYTKPITIDGNPGFEAYEKEGKHGSLSLFVAKRYLLRIETQGQDPNELQAWLKRIDLKKLAEVK